ncbi:MAG: type II toxin-antitoxin system prevent-host-death family antitoxin [Betaproteobacteria bacterium]|nr:type II toxin-antitoxin system prevent-host-death family antitoxin [Betaproteobacteria bacterium]
MKTVTAADANRHFSSVLRAATHGEVFVVVSRGKAVAAIGPARKKTDAQRSAAKAVLLKRLRAQRPTGKRAWTRDDLYRDRS